MVENIDFKVPTFGDHVLIRVKIRFKSKSDEKEIVVKRLWSKYSVARLCREMNESTIDDVANACSEANVVMAS